MSLALACSYTISFRMLLKSPWRLDKLHTSVETLTAFQLPKNLARSGSRAKLFILILRWNKLSVLYANDNFLQSVTNEPFCICMHFLDIMDRPHRDLPLNSPWRTHSKRGRPEQSFWSPDRRCATDLTWPGRSNPVQHFTWGSHHRVRYTLESGVLDNYDNIRFIKIKGIFRMNSILN